MAAARGRGLPVPQASGFTSLTGRGVRATIGGRTVLVGGPAIGGGTDVAVESAGVVLAGNDPRAVLSMVDLSRASYRKRWQNLVWATGYNIVAVPLAAGVLAFAGLVLSPATGAVLLSAATIVVALNAQLLRGLKLNPADVGVK